MSSPPLDGWAPEVYARFAEDRAAPFEDLLALLSPEDFERFCVAYRERLLRRLGSGPVFFAFRRVFLFAKLKAAA